ncbi:adenosine deaminase-like protein [Pomacea canaliculata]|uniref:adenosine deaminase-like protein n=1 Tax=Pomacea canaliculata TaxID=400727 RepID=UPI000D73B5E0|nr:adenosine deaminase-like protein [Pomacea canaliculata]
MTDPDIEQFCYDMPKIELHAHLNTSFSQQTLQALVARKAVHNSECLQWQMSLDDFKEMDDSFNIFKCIHQVVNDEEAVYKLTYDVIHEFAEDNVKYLELRSTPKDIPSTGMTRDLYVRTMLRAVHDCHLENVDIMVYILLSIDRRNSVEIAQLTVDLAEKFYKETGVVVGLDFSGHPGIGNAADFIPVFKSAKEKGLKISCHLAELAMYEETLAVLRQSPPDRIGHGTFLHRYDPGQGYEEIEDTVISKRIPIEACMTSNLKTNTVSKYSEHHFDFWFRKRHPVILCTDGKGVYKTSLSGEYIHAARTFSFSKQDLWQLTLGSIDHIFAPDTIKTLLHNKWQLACP